MWPSQATNGEFKNIMRFIQRAGEGSAPPSQPAEEEEATAPTGRQKHNGFRAQSLGPTSSPLPTQASNGIDRFPLAQETMQFSLATPGLHGCPWSLRWSQHQLNHSIGNGEGMVPQRKTGAVT